MGTILRIIILIIQIIAIYLYVLINKKNNGPYYKGIICGVIGYYMIIPLFINILFAFGNDDLKEKILLKNGLNYIVNAEPLMMMITGLIVFAIFVIFSMSYYSETTFSIGRAFSDRKTERIIKRNFYSTLVLIGNMCLIIGGCCTLYYIFSFGSISRAILLSGYVRGFTVDSIQYISYLASLMIIPGGIVVASPWCFLLTIDYNGGIWKKIKFITSIILSLLFLLVKAGRAPLLIFIVALGMPILIKRLKHPWVVFLFAAFIFMPLIDMLDALFDNSSITIDGYNIVSYVSQFSYPYRTALCAFDIVGQYGIRWGQDFITTFLGLLPGFNFDSTWIIVSEYYGGVSWKVTGSTPTDLYTFCIMEFHVFGLFLASILGFICRNLDRSLQKYKKNLGEKTYGINALESFVSLNAFWFVSTADFESLVRNMFFFCISILLLFTTKSMKR